MAKTIDDQQEDFCRQVLAIPAKRLMYGGHEYEVDFNATAMNVENSWRRDEQVNLACKLVSDPNHTLIITVQRVAEWVPDVQ